MSVAGLAGCLVAFGAFADGPQIRDVVVRQRWPWSRLVDINYVLDCDVTQRVDVAMTAYDSSAPITLPSGSLSGSLYGVSRGAGRIVFDPMKTDCTNRIIPQFRVDLAPTRSPLYMIVDLTNAVPSVTYIYPGDPALVTIGRWTTVWFGVTNDIAYKTDRLVLRRVPSGTFKMGTSPGVETAVSNELYVGVFEVTVAQWERIMKTGTGTSDVPKTAVLYNEIRGKTNDIPGINWPLTGSAVNTNSFMAKLRSLTGCGDFDLPTEVQWEYLCRAGTTSIFNDGDLKADLSGSNALPNSWLDALGWYSANTGVNQVHPVGQKTANCWGLYDMHGNAWEWCLDWASATARKQRGGSSWYAPGACTSTGFSSGLPDQSNISFGFRVVRVLPN